MSTLQVETFRVSEVAPRGWEETSENGWGYLVLLILQEIGLSEKVVRVPRNPGTPQYRDIVEESIASYVEAADVFYAPNFLDWLWYFQPPEGVTHFWGALQRDSAMSRAMRKPSPMPKPVRKAMIKSMKRMYGID